MSLFSSKRKKEKLLPSFTILELVFVIIIIAILATIAIPNLLATKDDAVLSSIKHEVSLITSSIVNYKTIKGDIDDISKVVAMDSNRWKTTEDKKSYIYKSDNKECIKIMLNDTDIVVLIANNVYNSSSICSKIRNMYDINIANKGANNNNYIIHKTISLKSLLEI